ncbi:NYN domain-containing protein [Helicobacter pylori]|uniref:NYN domain-containing protein n=1 Tax=Helicobacter pylori TaxID=210 RepID=UPI0024185632|nr:NYN domain-containing protein [Helicobacter pylori]
MKKENKENNKIAVFFDCENVSAEHVDFVFKELQNHGEVIIRQSFRDWEQENTKPWDRKLHKKFAIEPIQVFSKTKKNSCDLRIVRAIQYLKQSMKNILIPLPWFLAIVILEIWLSL